MQTDLGWIKSKWCLAISSRIFLLQYFDLLDNRDMDSAESFTKDQLYADGAFTARYKVSKYVDFSSQVGITLSFGMDDSSSGLNASLGILINIDFTKKSAE